MVPYETREWTFIGPSALLMDQHEVGKVFKVSGETIMDWVKKGIFPAPHANGKNNYWTGRDVTAMIPLIGRFIVENHEGI